MKLYTLSLHVHEIMSLGMIAIALIIATYYIGVKHGKE